MEEVYITIPKKKIKIKSHSIEEAIKKLRDYSKKQAKSQHAIIEDFFGIAKKEYKGKESDWYLQ